MASDNCRQHLDRVAHFDFFETGIASNSSVRVSTASRRALPGLKWGTRFSGMATLSPERGFLPMRGGRRLIEKLPKPRISTLCPRTRASLNASRIVLTAYSASRCANWPNRAANCSTRSLLVIKKERQQNGVQKSYVSVTLHAILREVGLFLGVIHLGAQQCTQICQTRTFTG